MTRVTGIIQRKRRLWEILPAALFVLIIGMTAEAQPLKHMLGDIPLPPEAYRKFLKVRPADELQALAEALPATYDARNEGIVTPAKNQGSCGSCWAFATVGAMESHLLKELGVGRL